MGALLVCQNVQAQRTNYNKIRFNENSNGKSTYHWVDGRYSLKVELEGRVEWNDDDSGVKSLSRNGRLEVEEKDSGRKYRIVVEPGEGNKLVYTYRKNGKKKELDNEGKRWLAKVLPQVIRESGMGAESRVQRILSEAGVEGVFEEIELIRSPGAKSLYLLYLFEQAELTGEETAKAAKIAQGISSPGDKTRFLITTARMFLIHDEAVDAYFEAVQSISSPGDKTRALIHLVDEELLKDERTYVIALRTAKTISSPGDKTRFMQKAVPFFIPQATDVYFETVNTISSPGDHARVLTSLLSSEGLDVDAMIPYLDSVRRISSPGDKARVLTQTADWLEENRANESLLERYFETAKSISSPGDRSRVLIHIFDVVDMSDESVLQWLNTVRTISSPGDKARVLLRASDRVADDDTLVDAYLATAETISSPSDRRRVLASLIE